MTGKAIGLARVSTTRQADDGCSLALQEEKIRAYAALNDLELVDIVVEAGISGRAKRREGLDTVMEMVRAGEVKHLIVYKLDRMSRSLRQAIEVVETLRKHNCQLHSITEKIDTSTSTGRFFFHVIGAIASWEAETISERTAAALQGKISRGERVGSVPYGFQVSSDGIHLEPHPAEQQTLQRMKWYAARNYSATKIAGALNRDGIPTKHNGQWHARQVIDILGRTA
jgi:site-specific DNA recombinase